MKRDVCDRCLKVNPDGDDYPVLSISLTSIHDARPIADMRMSICDECLPVVKTIIAQRIVLTSTPDDIMQGTMFGDDPRLPDEDAVQDAKDIEKELAELDGIE